MNPHGNSPNVMSATFMLNRYVDYRGGCWQWICRTEHRQSLVSGLR